MKTFDGLTFEEVCDEIEQHWANIERQETILHKIPYLRIELSGIDLFLHPDGTWNIDSCPNYQG